MTGQWDFPHAGISATGYSMVKGNAQEISIGGALHATQWREVRGQVDAAGTFTSSRAPLNPAGIPINTASDLLYSDSRRNLHLKLEILIDKTAPDHREIEGEVWLEYTFFPTLAPAVVIPSATKIGFSDGVWKAP